MKTNHDDWGGKWTQDKIDIFLKYLNAYLTIMSRYNFRLIYFDGFAGSGKIGSGLKNQELIEGVATQVISFEKPIEFNIYYLVDLNKKKAQNLESLIRSQFPNNKNRKTYVVSDDCNKKLVSMAKYLKEHKDFRALAYLDPYGMEINWSSLECFKELGCDMWILVPTGVGVNRMLTRNGEITSSWLDKLSKFLGISPSEIKDSFYKEHKTLTLFGEESSIIKEKRAVEKIISLYQDRLKNIWKYVSNAYPMKNSTGSIMFHFLLASQNLSAVKIADEIIGKKLF